MDFFQAFTGIVQRFHLLSRNIHLKEHLCMVPSKNITDGKAKINNVSVSAQAPVSDFFFDDDAIEFYDFRCLFRLVPKY